MRYRHQTSFSGDAFVLGIRGAAVDVAGDRIQQLEGGVCVVWVDMMNGCQEGWNDAHETPLRLSAIEQRILRLLADGNQSKEIAAKLYRSKPTVEFHVRALYAKLGARSRAHLVALAYRAGIIS